MIQLRYSQTPISKHKSQIKYWQTSFPLIFVELYLILSLFIFIMTVGFSPFGPTTKI